MPAAAQPHILKCLVMCLQRKAWTVCREAEAYQRFDLIGVVSCVTEGQKLSRRISCQWSLPPKCCEKDLFHEDVVTRRILIVFMRRPLFDYFKSWCCSGTSVVWNNHKNVTKYEKVWGETHTSQDRPTSHHHTKYKVSITAVFVGCLRANLSPDCQCPSLSSNRKLI